jgi:hypothetical protein
MIKSKIVVLGIQPSAMNINSSVIAKNFGVARYEAISRSFVAISGVKHQVTALSFEHYYLPPLKLTSIYIPLPFIKQFVPTRVKFIINYFVKL